MIRESRNIGGLLRFKKESQILTKSKALNMKSLRL